MRQRLTRVLAAVTLAALITMIPVTSASAARRYGPYSSQGTCNYWKYAMIAAGHDARGCNPTPGQTCPSSCPNTWYFWVY